MCMCVYLRIWEMQLIRLHSDSCGSGNLHVVSLRLERFKRYRIASRQQHCQPNWVTSNDNRQAARPWQRGEGRREKEGMDWERDGMQTETEPESATTVNRILGALRRCEQVT